jgi:MFS family permease
MVDFSFFKSRTFAGANLVAIVISFAMLAPFFFMALYMQNILGYSALEAGVRFLPSTLMIIFVAPIAGRLSDKIGPKPLIMAGLSLLSVSLFLQSQITVSSGYGTLLPAFIVLGLGIALTMSPMSTAAMNAVDVAKAGVASGVLSMGRMVGGSLGIAVTGALFQGKFTNRLDELMGTTSKATSDKLFEAVSSGQSSHIGGGANGQRMIANAHDAFIHALAGSMRLSLAVVVAGLVFSATLLKGGLPRSKRTAEAHPEAVAEPLGAQ